MSSNVARKQFNDALESYYNTESKSLKRTDPTPHYFENWSYSELMPKKRDVVFDLARQYIPRYALYVVFETVDPEGNVFTPANLAAILEYQNIITSSSSKHSRLY